MDPNNMADSTSQSRRDFLKQGTCGTAALGLAGIGMSLFQGCTPVKRITCSIANNQIEIDRSEFQEAKFVIVNNDALEAPIYVSKKSELFTACLMICTHKNCGLNPTGSFMTCPCHGSEFSNTGKVLNGPASEPLVQYKVVASDAKIIIHLNTLIKSS